MVKYIVAVMVIAAVAVAGTSMVAAVGRPATLTASSDVFVITGSTPSAKLQALLAQRDEAYKLIDAKDAGKQTANCIDAAPIEVRYRNTLRAIVFPVKVHGDLLQVFFASDSMSWYMDQCSALGVLDTKSATTALTTERAAESKLVADLKV